MSEAPDPTQSNETSDEVMEQNDEDDRERDYDSYLAEKKFHQRRVSIYQGYNNEEVATSHGAHKISKYSFLMLGLNALGVIYGDIGTSPLYVLNTIFPAPPSPEDAIGACSLIIYSLLFMVSAKYLIFIIEADNHNEGGIFALCSLLVRKASQLPLAFKRATIISSIIGASLLLGDGAITPAISVISAIEGLEVANPAMKPYVIPITIAILVILFALQPFGTGKVGMAFGPFVLLWLTALFGIGVYHISIQPLALYAFNPWMGIKFFVRNGGRSYYALGDVFLCITGMEALYADLGHFRRGPIRLTWLFLVLPGVVTNYLGQTAMLIDHPEKIESPFFSAVPAPIFWPVFVLATIAGIIASQAIITGSFSVVSQAVWFGFAPPFRIHQTSKKIQGQIYIPAVNWTLMVFTIAIVLGFGSSAAISSAYGVTVCTNEIICTALFMLVLHFHFKKPWWQVSGFLVFALFDVSFWGSILYKLPNGGWVAILISACFSVVMLIWYLGEYHLRRFRKLNDTSSKITALPHRLLYFAKTRFSGTDAFKSQLEDWTKKHPSPSKTTKIPESINPKVWSTDKMSMDSSRSKSDHDHSANSSMVSYSQSSGSSKSESESATHTELEQRSKGKGQGKGQGKGNDEGKGKDQGKNDSKKRGNDAEESSEESSGKDNTRDDSSDDLRTPDKGKEKSKTTMSDRSISKPKDAPDHVTLKVNSPPPTPKSTANTSVLEDAYTRRRNFSITKMKTAEKGPIGEGGAEGGKGGEAELLQVFPQPNMFRICMKDTVGQLQKHNLSTIPCTGVFLAYNSSRTPLSFETFMSHVSAIPQTVIFLLLEKPNVPFVPETDRMHVRSHFQSVFVVSIAFGYAEHVKNTEVLDLLTSEMAVEKGLPVLVPADVTFFAPADTIEVTNPNYAWKLILTLYSAMKGNFFGSHRVKLPPSNTIYIASVASL